MLQNISNFLPKLATLVLLLYLIQSIHLETLSNLDRDLNDPDTQIYRELKNRLAKVTREDRLAVIEVSDYPHLVDKISRRFNKVV